MSSRPKRHIPSEHLLHSIDRFVDVEEVRRDLAPFYSSIRRPSVVAAAFHER
jgi:hypothetical protein